MRTVANLRERHVRGEPFRGRVAEQRHVLAFVEERSVTEGKSSLDLDRREFGGLFAVLADANTLRFPPALVIDKQPPRTFPLPDLDRYQPLRLRAIARSTSSIWSVAPRARAILARAGSDGDFRSPASSFLR